MVASSLFQRYLSDLHPLHFAGLRILQSHLDVGLRFSQRAEGLERQIFKPLSQMLSRPGHV